MIENLLYWDSKLFLYINNWGIGQEAFWLLVTSHYFWLLLFIPLLFLFFKKPYIQFVYIIIAFALLILVSDQFANLIKLSVARPRPCQIIYLLKEMNFIATHCGAYGFYSAHAANSTAIVLFAVLLLKHLNRYKLLYGLYGLCFVLLVSISRIMVGVHYPLDLVVGYLSGIIFAYLFYIVYRLLESKLTKKA